MLHDLERGVDIQEYCDKANGVKCDKREFNFMNLCLEIYGFVQHIGTEHAGSCFS